MASLSSDIDTLALDIFVEREKDKRRTSNGGTPPSDKVHVEYGIP